MLSVEDVGVWQAGGRRVADAEGLLIRLDQGVDASIGVGGYAVPASRRPMCGRVLQSKRKGVVPAYR